MSCIDCLRWNSDDQFLVRSVRWRKTWNQPPLLIRHEQPVRQTVDPRVSAQRRTRLSWNRALPCGRQKTPRIQPPVAMLSMVYRGRQNHRWSRNRRGCCLWIRNIIITRVRQRFWDRRDASIWKFIIYSLLVFKMDPMHLDHRLVCTGFQVKRLQTATIITTTATWKNLGLVYTVYYEYYALNVLQLVISLARFLLAWLISDFNLTVFYFFYCKCN